MRRATGEEYTKEVISPGSVGQKNSAVAINCPLNMYLFSGDQQPLKSTKDRNRETGLQQADTTYI